MGKRTTDFMALTTILAGASLGIGLTTVFLAEGAPVRHVDDTSVEVHVLRRGLTVEPGRIQVRAGPSSRDRYIRIRRAYARDRARVRFSPDGQWLAYTSKGGVEPVWARDGRELFYGERADNGAEQETLERLVVQLQELLSEGREGREFREIFMADVRALELLENLDGNLTMTIDLLGMEHDGDDKRRRRRRRRPHRLAEGPDSDAPGN